MERALFIVLFLFTGFQEVSAMNVDSLKEVAEKAYYQGEHDVSLDNYQKVYDYYKKNNISDTRLNSAITFMGEIYRASSHYDIAIRWLNKAIRKATLETDPYNHAYSHNRLAAVYFETGQFDSALYHVNVANKVSVKNGFKDLSNLNLIVRGAIQRDLGNYGKALADFKVVYHDYRKENDNDLPNIMNNMANTFYQLGIFDSAISYAQKSYSIARKKRIKTYARGAAFVLSQAYGDMNRYDSAFKYYTLMTTYKDSILSEERERLIREMEGKFNIREKEKQNLFLREEQKNNAQIIERQETIQLFMFIIIGLLFLIALIIFINHRRKIAAYNKMELLNNEIRISKLEVEETNYFKDKILSIVAHDIRSPLASLKSLMNIIEDLDRKNINIMMKEINNQVDNIMVMLENLLSWARTQMDGVRVNRREFNIRDLIKENVLIYDQLIEKKELEVRINVPSQEVLADKQMINLVIRNILTNSIKFSSRGREIIIDATRKNGEIKIFFTDTGIGISDDQKKNIFNSLVESQPGTENEKGTGIGLAISKTFVKANGGEIGLESKEGEGTVVYFTLPIH